MSYEFIRDYDTELYDAMENELQRQRDHIELIASENFTSRAVMQAMGSHLTNKYAEGYPGARYYGGCEYVDVVEQLAIDRVKALFGAEHANVQPHSGSQANVPPQGVPAHDGRLVLHRQLPDARRRARSAPLARELPRPPRGPLVLVVIKSPLARL